MTDEFLPIGELIDRVRSRWRRLLALRAATRAAVSVTAILAAVLAVAPLAARVRYGRAVTAAFGLAVLIGACAWLFRSLRGSLPDARIARFIEEQHGDLDERLVSAVSVASTVGSGAPGVMARSLVADAARAATAIDPAAIVRPAVMRRASLQAILAVALLITVAVVARERVRQSFAGLSSALLSGRTELQAEAAAAAPAPRVTRIDVEYTYPKTVGLAPRTEEDGGDIYAPAGTDVRLLVRTDRPAASGRLLLADGVSIDLTPEGEGRSLTGSLQVVADNSYRVTLADATGQTRRGDTEYFIRTLEDRPPEVHVTKPASDRRVTRLEEVDVEAEAEDDFGVASLDLVYTVRGGTEHVAPLPIPSRSTTVTGRRTIYLEDLDVRPGDFVSYYVRARDLPRGKASSESRSDIFFLEVKPFEEEFTLAQTQASAGGAHASQLTEELAAAQKQVIVATWKLDRRSQAASGAQSREDIAAVARAEKELKTRVEQASSSFRQSSMRDPRSRPGTGRAGSQDPSALRAGQTLAEEDAMASASIAMGQAAVSLDALKTHAAIAPEMEALDYLLKAQADVKKRQVQQQAGRGGGSNRSNMDLSSLFDKELARHQQTSYETPQNASEQGGEKQPDAVDKIKDLASRQDELLKKQQALARDRGRLSAEELKRQLESLTREQNDLRQRAEEMAREMARQQGESDQSQSQQGQRQPGQRQQGEQSQSGQPGQPGQQSSTSARGSAGADSQMREISEEMRGAAGDLRREDAGQAAARAARALDKLRGLEQQLQANSPDGRRRAMGDLELEARQLADAERQLAGDASRAQQGQQGEAGLDALRRLAGEQDRLADRVRRVQDGLNRQASSSAQAASETPNAKALRQAAGEAAREMDRQRLEERMRQSADAMRAAAGRGASQPTVSAPQGQEVARALDRLADTLAAAERPGDDESRKLSASLARSQDLRQRLDDLTKQLDQLNSQAGQPGQSGKSGQGQGGSGQSSADVGRLRDQLDRDIREARELLAEMRRNEPAYSQGGAGLTFEGQGMTLSAPGTEAFKQDFSKWQEMKRQLNAALDQVDSTLARRLQDRAAKDRLAAGVDDKAPAAYQQQVDSYFKALAARQAP